MRRFWILTSVLFLIGAATVVVGCGNGHGDHMNNSVGNTTMQGGTAIISPSGSVPALVSIWPTDGMTEVPIDGTIHMKFSVPMDTGAVMVGFHLAHGDDMHAWMDSLEHMQYDSGGHGDMGGHGGMGGNGGMGGHGEMMDMDDMMDWMDSMDVHGEFHWNAAMDNVVFVPESTMIHNGDYMIIMNMGSMMSHDGHMMDTIGHSHGLDTYHFTTGLPELTDRKPTAHDMR